MSSGQDNSRSASPNSIRINFEVCSKSQPLQFVTIRRSISAKESDRKKDPNPQTLTIRSILRLVDRITVLVLAMVSPEVIAMKGSGHFARVKQANLCRKTILLRLQCVTVPISPNVNEINARERFLSFQNAGEATRVLVQAYHPNGGTAHPFDVKLNVIGSRDLCHVIMLLQHAGCPRDLGIGDSERVGTVTHGTSTSQLLPQMRAETTGSLPAFRTGFVRNPPNDL